MSQAPLNTEPQPLPPLPPLAEPAERSDRLERRAGWLLLLLLALVIGTIAYVLYARGAFERTQRLVLLADDSEGVLEGMDLTFSGFPIGRVRRVELAADGTVRILVDVPVKDARWLRTSSIFTMTRGLVGGTQIKAYSGVLADPPLPAGAERKLLAGDTAAEIPKLMGQARELLTNLSALTAQDSELRNLLAHVESTTRQLDQRLGAKGGALELLMGQDAPKLAATLDATRQLLTRVDGVVQRTDGLIARADGKLLGEQGLVDDAQAAVRQLNQLLADARGSLRKVDGLLQDAQAVAANAKLATADLGALRAEVDASLRKVEQLVNEINRRWPFKRDPELKLP